MTSISDCHVLSLEIKTLSKSIYSVVDSYVGTGEVGDTLNCLSGMITKKITELHKLIELVEFMP
jgi:hypothetical protein